MRGAARNLIDIRKAGHDVLLLARASDAKVIRLTTTLVSAGISGSSSYFK
jgi:hypothetical protein